MLFVVGFNKSIAYKKGTRIEVMISKGYNKTDIETIAKETFQNRKILVQDVEKLNQVFSVKLENYTQEELDNFKTKISEKYNIDVEKLELYEIPIPSTRISTVITPYMFPTILATIISIVYIVIRNIKNKNIIREVFKILINLVLIEGIYFSIIVITQIPFTTYTMPIALTLYIATLLFTITKTNTLEEI